MKVALILAAVAASATALTTRASKKYDVYLRAGMRSCSVQDVNVLPYPRAVLSSFSSHRLVTFFPDDSHRLVTFFLTINGSFSMIP
jgi:hypothetical protein